MKQNAFACIALSASLSAQNLSCRAQAPAPWEQQALLEPRVHTFLAMLNVPKKDAEQAQSRNIYSCCFLVKVGPGNQARKIKFAKLRPIQPAQLL